LKAVLKTIKLASAGYLDGLPDQGDKGSYAFRDHGMEARLMEISRELGIGAQFGGKHFCLDARVIRMPRHGASCPVGIGVSCSADRNIKAKVTREGIFLENLDRDPARFLPAPDQIAADAVDIDLDQPMDVIGKSFPNIRWLPGFGFPERSWWPGILPMQRFTSD